MSKLLFDGAMHQLTLYLDGAVLGKWTAYNNVDRHATLTHVENGLYVVMDRRSPRNHIPSANGPYGLHGIIRFSVPGHPGVGVHSGRAFAKHMPGPQHPTTGCIRTTDEAMSFIVDVMKRSPLTTIQIIRNSAPAALAASTRYEGRKLQGARNA